VQQVLMLDQSSREAFQSKSWMSGPTLGQYEVKLILLDTIALALSVE